MTTGRIAAIAISSAPTMWVSWASRGFGLALLAIGAVAIMTAHRSTATEQVARSVALGFSFPVSHLAAIERLAEGGAGAPCAIGSSAARMALLGRIAEDARRTQPIPETDAIFAEWISSIEETLRCRPTDGYAWLSLYWALMLTEGPSTRALGALELSYRFAPHEGWIAVPRVRTTASALPVLPPVARSGLVEDVRYLVLVNRPQELSFLMSRAQLNCADLATMLASSIPVPLATALRCDEHPVRRRG